MLGLDIISFVVGATFKAICGVFLMLAIPVVSHRRRSRASLLIERKNKLIELQADFDNLLSEQDMEVNPRLHSLLGDFLDRYYRILASDSYFEPIKGSPLMVAMYYYNHNPSDEKVKMRVNDLARHRKFSDICGLSKRRLRSIYAEDWLKYFDLVDGVAPKKEEDYGAGRAPREVCPTNHRENLIPPQICEDSCGCWYEQQKS